MIERIARPAEFDVLGSGVTGNCSRGTGTMPQAGQWITGIGQPQ